MKLLTTSLLLLATTYALSQVESNQYRHSESKHEKSALLISLPLNLFLSGTYPEDLPAQSMYTDENVYRKVIQGYINTHADLIDENVAVSLGYTFPLAVDQNEKELHIDKKRRTEPVSEENKQLKIEKSNQLNKN